LLRGYLGILLCKPHKLRDGPAGDGEKREKNRVGLLQYPRNIWPDLLQYPRNIWGVLLQYPRNNWRVSP
jgi:hypothetical protein